MAKVTRREFVRTGAVLGAGVAVGAEALRGESWTAAPAVHVRGMARPMVIASGNGNLFRNGGDATAVSRAYSMIVEGADVLDAVVAGVNINELDPADDSVGYGGLPNDHGVVQLDASCMHGPRKRAGAVAALEGVRTPSLVAKAVLELTDHHLLVGDDAQMFARQMGFEIEDDLNTPNSRRLWLEWKRRTDPGHWLTEEQRRRLGMEAGLEMVRDGLIHPEHYYGTINCDGVNAAGDICGVTTTSGLAWKIPGRVGDSPILGAGLYLDNDVGAAGSTGRGEANLYNLTSYLIVENMRRGMSPKDAGMEGLRRIVSNTIERRLLNSRGRPNFNVSFYVLNKRGEYAGVGLYGGRDRTFAVCDERGPRNEPIEPLFEGSPGD